MNFFDTDSYKVSQYKQYPEGATKAQSYVEARGGAEEVRFFGLQYILDNLQIPTINEIFITKEIFEVHFGRSDIFNFEGWIRLVELGYYPLEIKAVPEGGVYKTGSPLITVENTHPDFVWLVSWFETQILRIWYPTTVATRSYEIKKLISKYLEKNGTPESIDFKLHDFGSRGATTPEAAGIGGLSHLINFKGTDTLKAFEYAWFHYTSSTDLGYSIPASEHSTITSWGREGELDAYRNMISKFGEKDKIFACVSDSYNIWEALKMWKLLESDILDSGATLVIRPDSGDPVETPVKVLEECLDLFGYEINNKGYKILPSHIRVIQGDGIDFNSIWRILKTLDDKGISSDNITFGMGGALLQKLDRDTYKFAMKMCGITINGEDREVYKDPITDPGKKSKRGYIKDDNLRTVWCDGNMLIRDTIQTIRSRA